MAKKDKVDQREPLQPELGKDSRKCFDKIQGEWDKSPDAYLLEKLTLPALRLLFEHHQPLQDLIRTIAATGLSNSPSAATQVTSAAQAQVQAEALKLRQQCQDLQNDLQQCSASTQKLLQEKTAAQEALRQAEKQLQQAHKELTATRAELTRAGAAPTELKLLQNDAELARRLELADLPENATQALMRVVAVLAQRENLERLWTALKERCEAEKRTVNTQERALLAAALSWYNHNWRNKPYKLVEIAPGTAYDFERHLRSQHTPGGEMVRELRLPGIADGSGRSTNCKPLVSTQ